MRLKDKVALITGAAGGIGREAAVLFAGEGAAVVVADVNAEAGQATASLIREQGGRAAFVRADVSKSADCANMVAVAEQTFGKLNVLFNNAGIMHPRDGDAIATDEDVWDLTQAINLKGVFVGCRSGIPALRRTGGGTIINMGSFVALLGSATADLAYAASKGGVLALSRELAIVHARENIRVNALCPG